MKNDVFPSGTKGRGIYLPLLAGPCHLESADILDRLVELVPDEGTYFELGAWTASTACYVADHRPKATVIAADRFPDPLRAMLALANVAHRPNVRLWRGPAQSLLRLCRPGVFDVAFIDGDHHGPAVARDLRLVGRKMKPSGKICCHDYEAPKHPGVTDSVNEFCGQTEWCVSGRCWSLVVLGRSDAGAG